MGVVQLECALQSIRYHSRCHFICASKQHGATTAAEANAFSSKEQATGHISKLSLVLRFKGSLR